MAKLTTNPIGSGHGETTLLNDNFDLIETAMENTLSRDGTTPNSMAVDLDLDGNLILNQGNAVTISAWAWEGDWSNATAYSIGDAVQHNGSAYIATAINTNQEPPNATYWSVIVSSTTPSQTGNADKPLTTDGSSTSWGSIHSDYVDYTHGGTGSAERTLLSKAQDIVSVKDFGAVGDGVTDDTAAIQAAVDYIKTLEGTGTDNTSPICLWFPPAEYLVTDTIDMTSIETGHSYWYVDMRGAVINGNGASLVGKSVFDLIDSRKCVWTGGHILGDQTNAPRSGLQIGREVDESAADGNVFQQVEIEGYFTTANLINISSEECTFYDLNLKNYDTGTSYCLVLDGENIIGGVSDSTLMPQYTKKPFNANTFINLDARHTGGGAANAAVYLSAAVSHRFIGSYVVATGAGFVLDVHGATDYIKDLHIDAHVEQSTSVDFAIKFDSTSANQTEVVVDGLYYREQNLNVAKAAIGRNTAQISGGNGTIIRNADIQINDVQINRADVNILSSATDISFTAPSTIGSTSTDFTSLGMSVGDPIEIQGSTSNDDFFTVSSIATNSLVVTEADVTTEAAGDTVAIKTPANIFDNNGQFHVTGRIAALDDQACLNMDGLDFNGTFLCHDQTLKPFTTGDDVLISDDNGSLRRNEASGTWTPTAADAVTAGNTGGTGTGTYVKINGWIHAHCSLSNIDTTGLTAGNDFYIQGLPEVSDAAGGRDNGVITVNGAAFSGQLIATLDVSTSAIRLMEMATATSPQDYVIVSEITDDTDDLFIDIMYKALET